MILICYALHRAHTFVPSNQRILVCAKEVVDCIAQKLSSARHAYGRVARQRQRGEFAQSPDHLVIICNHTLDAGHFSAKHDRRGDHVDQAVGKVQAQHSGSQRYVYLLEGLLDKVLGHPLVGCNVLIYILIQRTKSLICHDLVGFIPRDDTSLGIFSSLDQSITSSQTELIYKLIQRVKQRELLLLGNVERSLDIVAERISNFALEAGANAASNRLTDFAVLFREQPHLREELATLHLHSFSHQLLFLPTVPLEPVLIDVLKASLRQHVSQLTTTRQFTVHGRFIHAHGVVILSFDLEIVLCVLLVKDVKVITQAGSLSTQGLFTLRSQHAHIRAKSHLALGLNKGMEWILHRVDWRGINNRHVRQLTHQARCIIQRSELALPHVIDVCAGAQKASSVRTAN